MEMWGNSQQDWRNSNHAFAKNELPLALGTST